MDGGKIVEQGTHAELLAAHGAYHTLHHAQFAGPQTPEPSGPSGAVDRPVRP